MRGQETTGSLYLQVTCSDRAQLHNYIFLKVRSCGAAQPVEASKLFAGLKNITIFVLHYELHIKKSVRTIFLFIDPNVCGGPAIFISVYTVSKPRFG